MSFNLSKLVQPECGGPNPLVAAAQHITARPQAGPSRMFQQATPSLNLTKEFIQQQQYQAGPSSVSRLAIMNMRSQQQQPFQGSVQYTNSNQLYSQTINSTQNEGRLATDFLSQHENQLTDSVKRMQINSTDENQVWPLVAAYPTPMGLNQMTMLHNMHSSLQMPTNTTTTTITAAVAGEQLESKYRKDMISQSNQRNDQMKGDGKTQDLEFWQALSQKYIGPTTQDNINKLRNINSELQNEQEASEKTDTVETTEASDLTSEEIAQLASSSEVDAFERELRERSRIEEYIFDERNPLKDQFEDPFAEGLKKLELGDIPSAALLFEAAVQQKPDDAVAWRYLGTTQAQNEKDRSAIKALKTCLKLNPADQQARLAIAVSLANEAFHHEACKHLLEWLISHDRYKAVNANMSEFTQLDSELNDDPFYMNAVDQKHYRYVRDKFVDAARLSPQDPDPEVQSALGVLFNIRGEYEKAVDCFRAALSVRSNDSLLWNRLGATLANGNKSDEAVIAYRKALDLAPGFLRSRYNLAISLIHLNTYDEAAKQLVQILNMQAAGKGSKNTQIRTRSITSTSIWNTLRTVATLMNKPELYPIIDGRDLARCNVQFLQRQE